MLFYAGGAIIGEVVYRLLPIPLLLWLSSTVLLRGRAQDRIFWVLALLTSAIEPITQELGLLGEGRAGLFAVHFTMGYALNLAQAALFPSAWTAVSPLRRTARSSALLSY